MAPHPQKLRSATARKKRKTFILSSDVVDYIKNERRSRHTESASLVLEQMIREHRHKHHAKNVSVAMTSYYDSLSEAEQNESERWGEFSETQFPLE